MGGVDIQFENQILAALLAIVVIVVLFAGVGKASKSKKAQVYLAGYSADNEQRVFKNSLSGTTEATLRNWYLEGIFGEARIRPVGEWVCGIIIVAAIIISAFGSAVVF